MVQLCNQARGKQHPLFIAWQTRTPLTTSGWEVDLPSLSVFIFPKIFHLARGRAAGTWGRGAGGAWVGSKLAQMELCLLLFAVQVLQIQLQPITAEFPPASSK